MPNEAWLEIREAEQRANQHANKATQDPTPEVHRVVEALLAIDARLEWLGLRTAYQMKQFEIEFTRQTGYR